MIFMKHNGFKKQILSYGKFLSQALKTFAIITCIR